MHHTVRKNAISRYSPSIHSMPHHSPGFSAVVKHEKAWINQHVVMIGVLAVLGLGASFSGIYWKAVQLAAYAPQVSASSRPPETVDIPSAIELAQTEPTPPPPTPVADEGLNNIINSWASNHPSVDWSIAVNGLGDDDRFANFNADQKRGLASVYKIFLLYPLFQKVPLEQFNSTIIYTDSGSHTIGECVDAMLRYSDNECGVAVGRYVGWSHTDHLLNGLGFSHTELYSDNGTESSASDTAKLLSELWGGDMFTDAQRQYVINIMKSQIWRNGIPAGCSGCEVADKTGSLSYISNDAGIVYFSDKNYTLVIFSNGAGFDSIAQLTSQIHSYMVRQ